MNDWISVKTILPEIKDKTKSSESEDVLFIADDGRMYVGHLNYYPVSGYRTEEKYSWTENVTGCGCCGYSLDATYWMPLPKPPER